MITLIGIYFQIKNIIINGPYKIRHFAKKLAYTYNLNLIDPVIISEDFLNKLVSKKIKCFMVYINICMELWWKIIMKENVIYFRKPVLTIINH